MKYLKILITLFIIFSFELTLVKAQVSQKISCQTINVNTFNRIGNLDTAFCRGNFSGLYQPTGSVPKWINLAEKTNYDRMTTDRDYNDLINKSILFNCPRNRSAEKSGYIPGNGNYGTFISKWERLTGKPIFDTTCVYYYPLKRTNAPSLSDNHFYRLTGSIFNMFMDMKYPSRNTSK